MLEAQAYAVARAYGLEDALAAEGVERDRIGRTAARAWRWTAEMHEIGDTHAALGLDDGIARGAAASLERWAAHRDDAQRPARRAARRAAPTGAVAPQRFTRGRQRDPTPPALPALDAIAKMTHVSVT